MNGYIRGHYIVSPSGRILATITSDRDACAYGSFSRRHVRAVDNDGSSWAGSCRSDQDHVRLRRVNSRPEDFASELLREYIGRVAS